MNNVLFSVLFSISFVVLLGSQEAFAEPGNTQVELIGMDATNITFKITDPDGFSYSLTTGGGGGGGGFVVPCLLPPRTMETIQIPVGSSFQLTVLECEEPADVTVWFLTQDGATQTGGIPFMPQIVGGVFITIDTTSLLLAYGLVNSYWIAPTAVGIGVGIYLVKRKIE